VDAERHGFSLIELMIVMAVVIVMTAVGVAFTGPYVARRQVEGLAFEMVQDLRNAQSTAVFTRSYLAVTLDVPNSRYSFERTSGGTPVVHELNSVTGFASSVLGASFTGDCVYFTSSAKSTAAAPASVTFYFSPRGVPVTAQSETATIDAQLDGKGGLISLAGRGGGRIEIRISPVVGQATMEWK
jgi:prepilin-type N-terminal cleavage/methylation domain-containing protein